MSNLAFSVVCAIPPLLPLYHTVYGHSRLLYAQIRTGSHYMHKPRANSHNASSWNALDLLRRLAQYKL